MGKFCPPLGVARVNCRAFSASNQTYLIDFNEKTQVAHLLQILTSCVKIPNEYTSFMHISNGAQTMYFFMAFFVLQYGRWSRMVKIYKKYFLLKEALFSYFSMVNPWVSMEEFDESTPSESLSSFPRHVHGNNDIFCMAYP